MDDKYSDELLNMKFSVEVLDGIKPEQTFFSITEDTLRNVYHVLPTDTVEEARGKILDVVSRDDFLYEYFHKDPMFWELKSFEPGYWTTPARVDKLLPKDTLDDLGYDEEDYKKMRFPLKETQVIKTFQQKLTIKFAKRNLTNVFTDEKMLEIYEEKLKETLSRDNIFTSILKDNYELKPTKPNKKAKYDPDKLLVIPDVELHLGKLASKFDSTDSYDYKKALFRYIKIMREAEKVQEKYNAKEICMTIGNDFFNTDTEQNTTTAGTEQHNDTRFQQMIANGVAAHIWAIEKMKQHCEKIYIKFNPGNHDHLIDYALYVHLYYLYRNDPKIEISGEIKNSRWATGLVWHNNLLIFAHGKTPEGKALNDKKLSELKDTMFKEEAKGVDNVVIHAGHLHNASVTGAPNGVIVSRNGSPSGDGAWDSGNLYSSDKTHQVYVYDADNGLYSTVNIKIPKEDMDKSITVPSVTAETDYIKTIEKSIEKESNSIVMSESKKKINRLDNVIRKINKKYELMFENVISSLGVSYTEEQKRNIISSLGYDAEIRPFIEEKEELENNLNTFKKSLTKA